ncbi:MAG: enoyl-CoA hydratase/isomerase family protein [Gemmatimonadota bacterium]
MSAGASTVHLERGDRTARLVLDRPPLNVLDVPMLRELGGKLAEVAADPEVGVLVLTGAGRAFCAGVDVADHLPDRVGTTLELFHEAVRRLRELEMPVVAAVNGAALGGGCELLLACDVGLAREGAKLGQPEVRLGALPPAAAALLPRRVGYQRALELILTGRTLDAAEAERFGLVTRVLPADRFEGEVDRYVAGLASLSRPVLRLAKRAVLEGLELPWREALERAQGVYLEELAGLADAREGLAAFLEKREPVWSDT